MSTLSVIVTVLVILALLAGLTAVACLAVESVRKERQRQQDLAQTMLTELELQRMTRTAVNRIFDAARRAHSESWRDS